VAADTARLIAVGALRDGLWLVSSAIMLVIVFFLNFFYESYNFKQG
jgi:hypothetical protein